MPKRARSSPAATKQDIEEFANLIGGYCIRAEQKIDDLESHMRQWKEDLREQVQLMMDEHRRELVSAKGDEVATLKDRMKRLDEMLYLLDEQQSKLDRVSRERDVGNKRSIQELEFQLSNVRALLARMS